MATVEERNLEDFRTLVHTLTGGKSGVKDTGVVYAATTESARDAAWVRDALTPGVSGKRSPGSVIALLASIEAQGAVTANLVKALANVSGGEQFDEAKLLAGISKAVFDNSKAGAEAGVANAIEAIDTTVTIKQEEAK